MGERCRIPSKPFFGASVEHKNQNVQFHKQKLAFKGLISDLRATLSTNSSKERFYGEFLQAYNLNLLFKKIK